MALILGAGTWLGQREGPRPVATATPDAAATDASFIDGGTEAVVGPPAYILDLDTGAETLLPEAISGSLGEPPPDPHGRYAASPDGSTLAYVAEVDGGRFQVFVADLDGTGIRQVTNDPVGAASPAWSPDGAKIAYSGYTRPGARGLFVLDVATGEATKVIDVATEWPEPTFTPDGSSLLYSSEGDVLTVPVSGGGSTLLFGHGRGGMGYAGVASMSPDGSLVTMLGNEPGGPGALRFVANVDGTDLRTIEGPAGSSNPAGTWSPDGTRIVCQAWSERRILVVDVATGNVTKVAEGDSAIWLDDHTLLVEA
jgi:Tol biopolymer transport system component